MHTGEHIPLKWTSARSELRVLLPVVGLVLVGLLADSVPREEVYTSLDYGFSLVTLFGAMGCAGYLAVRLSRSSSLTPLSCSSFIKTPPAAFAPLSERGADWPLLVALFLGPFVVLLSGLGGWV